MSITLSEGQTKKLDISLTPVYVPPEPATLYGTVTEAGSGYAISGALVEVVGTGLSDYTISNGSYQITNIPAGTYTIRFSHPDYDTKEV